MTVTYEMPLSRSGAQLGESLVREVITEGMAYARGPRSTRWHRVRSGQRILDEHWETGELRIRESFTTWCGQSIFDRGQKDPRPILFADASPEGQPSCGTCEGRAIGADATHPAWLFSPTRLTPPRWCPGSRSQRLVVELPSRPGMRAPARCLVCGFEGRMSAGGSWHSGTWGLKQHTPGPGLIPGCPWHAWREITRAVDDDGHPVAGCRCKCVTR